MQKIIKEKYYFYYLKTAKQRKCYLKMYILFLEQIEL